MVANEIKALANQSVQTTDDIWKQIEIIQVNTETITHSIGEISQIVTEINEINNTIASAIEEQSIVINNLAKM